MIAKNNQEITNFIHEIKAVQTNHIAEYFYKDKSQKYTIARRKLRKLTEYTKIKRDRIHINQQYTYYTCSKRQVDHQLQLANFIVELNKIADIINWKTEFKIKHLQADMIATFKYNNTNRSIFIESHNKSDNFNFEKYEKLYVENDYKDFYKELLGIVPRRYNFPSVIIISDKKLDIPSSNINFIQLNRECTDIQKIL